MLVSAFIFGVPEQLSLGVSVCKLLFEGALRWRGSRLRQVAAWL